MANSRTLLILSTFDLGTPAWISGISGRPPGPELLDLGTPAWTRTLNLGTPAWTRTPRGASIYSAIETLKLNAGNPYDELLRIFKVIAKIQGRKLTIEDVLPYRTMGQHVRVG